MSFRVLTDPDWDDMIAVGRVARPHGRHGQVVISPDTDFGSERFRIGQPVWRLADGRPTRLVIRDSRPFDGRWVVGFEGVGSIDEAETLRGSELRVPSETLRPLGPRQYYVHELAGCRVETIDGSLVGHVERVEFGTGTPTLVVSGARGEAMVPLAEDICRRVDVAARLIVIDPPAGLLELNG